MSTLTNGLTAEDRARLRLLAREAEDIAWPARLARNTGWAEANGRFHAVQRAQGGTEMTALPAAPRLTPPPTKAELTDVLLTAVDIFLHTDGIDAIGCADDHDIAIDISRCPIYDHLDDPYWRGATACG